MSGVFGAMPLADCKLVLKAMAFAAATELLLALAPACAATVDYRHCCGV